MEIVTPIDVLKKAREVIIKPGESTLDDFSDRGYRSLYEICNALDFAGSEIIRNAGLQKLSWFRQVIDSVDDAVGYLSEQAEWYQDLDYPNGTWFGLKEFYTKNSLGMKLFDTVDEMQQARLDLLDKTIDSFGELISS